MTILMSDKGYVKTRFECCSNPYEITGYLKHVYMNMGSKPKDQKVLFHYSNINSIHAILSNGCFWLGSISRMNDYLESEFYNSSCSDKLLYFASFSRFDENLAMYKMYGDRYSGASLKISYSDMISLVNSLQIDSTEYYDGVVVHDSLETDKHIRVKMYLATVCYKELHSNVLKVGTVSNNLISNPLNNPELAGFVKLDGWEYEKEVRLCAETDIDLGVNDRIAIHIPTEIIKKVEVIKCPGFDNGKNKNVLSKLKRIGITIRESEYESLVDLYK